jgi:hypothetical protein
VNIVAKIRQAWTWLKTKIGLAAVVLVLTLGGQAKADDATNLELWKQQMNINRLMERRVAELEKRVTLLEQKTPTAYSPGSPTPQPVYTPTYVAPTPYVSAPTGPGGWDAEFLRRCYGK